MKLSIVIPIYKVEKYLHECVDSVLSQTFQDYELILVDDGSPDKCPQICDEYASRDNRIKVVHQKNAGLACARNAGIRVAQGEYLICIDSDDYLASEAVLDKIAEKADGNTDVVLYGFRKLFESNNTFGQDETPNLKEVSNTSQMLTVVFSNNSFGGSIILGSDGSNLGGHSAFLDRLGSLGLIGFIPYVIFIWRCLVFSYNTISNNSKVFYFVGAFMSLAMLSSKALSGWDMWLVLLFVLPSILQVFEQPTYESAFDNTKQ